MAMGYTFPAGCGGISFVRDNMGASSVIFLLTTYCTEGTEISVLSVPSEQSVVKSKEPGKYKFCLKLKIKTIFLVCSTAFFILYEE